MTDKLIFTKNGVDILDGIDLRNGKANPFGWSTYEVWLTEHGGEPINLAPGFGFRIEKGQ